MLGRDQVRMEIHSPVNQLFEWNGDDKTSGPPLALRVGEYHERVNDLGPISPSRLR
jgi:hypothetical protein